MTEQTHEQEFIHYGKQKISDEDIQAVAEVLRSDYLTQGPVTPQFEQGIANYTSAKFAVAVNSATSGLHLALKALGVTNGDIVWTSAITFVATSNAALYCNAEVDFVDIDPATMNISIEALRYKLEVASAKNNLPRVVIPVHMGGLPADMRAIHELSKQYGFEIIEDASHAIGANYEGQKIGNCQYSTLCVFSFHPVKIITSAEGGMVTTNDEVLAVKLSSLRTHGIIRSDPDYSSEQKELWNYLQVDLGYNYRLSELHAALGLSQLKKIDQFIEKRKKIFDIYKLKCQELPVSIQSWDYQAHSSYHLMLARLHLNSISTNKIEVYNFFLENNIQANFHYIPVYRHPYYQRLGFKKGYCPEAENYFSDALSLPLHPSLAENDVERVISTLERSFNG